MRVLSLLVPLLAVGTLMGVVLGRGPLPELPRPAIQGAPLDAEPGAVGQTALEGTPTTPVESWEVDGVLRFGALAFDDYDPPEVRGVESPPLVLADFPEGARSFAGQEVTLEGYALVTTFTLDKVDGFLLQRYPPGCCFGSVPVLDEWVRVELTAAVEPRDLLSDVRVRGTLDVGERFEQDGFVESLYRLSSSVILDL